jgi:leucine dehydrogenase
MEIFRLLGEHDHEQLVYCYEPAASYKGVIVIHDTTLGPALGGTRVWEYRSEAEAVVDALRLSRGMTYKAAVAGLTLGGGKSVILAPTGEFDREALFRAHGRFIESLGGRYITAEDLGTSPIDMDYVHMETSHVVGLQGKSGDPSPITAYGVYAGMKACAHVVFGDDRLADRSVAVQGAGHVGYQLCRHLAEEGARIVVSDIDRTKAHTVVEEFGAKAVAPEAIYAANADIFAPCALGAVVNDETLTQFKCRIIAGGANNVLAEERHGDALEKMGILYAPDYVVNAGGLINVNAELVGWPAERAKAKAGDIYDTLLRVFAIATREKIPTYRAADRLAEKRIESVRRLKKTWI